MAYSPLGRGFLAGKAVDESLPSQSHLATHPKFSGEILELNMLYKRFSDLASKHDGTPSQLALAWLLHQGNDIAPIPGSVTLHLKHFNFFFLILVCYGCYE